jgi:hypothetical protein
VGLAVIVLALLAVLQWLGHDGDDASRDKKRPPLHCPRILAQVIIQAGPAPSSARYFSMLSVRS